MPDPHCTHAAPDAARPRGRRERRDEEVKARERHQVLRSLGEIRVERPTEARRCCDVREHIGNRIIHRIERARTPRFLDSGRRVLRHAADAPRTVDHLRKRAIVYGEHLRVCGWGVCRGWSRSTSWERVPGGTASACSMSSAVARRAL